jgi:EmrB/QacA subfamily drug resistance transporter
MVAIMIIGVLLAVLNQTLLSPAFPAIMAEFQIDTTTVQWLASGYSLVEAVIIPLSAFLIGRLSTRRLFIGGMATFTAGSALAAWAPSFGVLLAGRILQALGTGAMMPMVTTVIMLVFPREKRGTAMGMIGLIIGFAPAVGPAVSGLIIDSFGWHILFGVVAILACAILLLAVLGLKDYGSFERVPLDGASLVLSSIGLPILLYGLSTFASSTNYVLTAAMIIAGIVLLALFVRRQNKLEHPMLRMNVLSSKRFATAVGVIALMQAALVSMSVTLPLYIQSVLGQTATVSGLVTLPGAVAGAIMAIVAGRIFDRSGARKIALCGGILTVCAGIGLCLLGAESSVILITVANLGIMVGVQLVMTPLNTWGINSLDNSVVQHANGLSQTLNQMAGSFGTALVVSLGSVSASFVPDASATQKLFVSDHVAFITVTVLFAIGLSLIIFRVRDKRREGAQPKTRSCVGKADQSALSTTGKATMANGTMQNASSQTITVADAMDVNAPVLYDDATVGDALKVFAASETSGITISDHDGTVIGFVSDGDIMGYLGKIDTSFIDPSLNIYVLFDDDDLRSRLTTLLALDVMKVATKKVITIEQSVPLDSACHVLAQRRIKKLPVVHEGALVGAISRRNVMYYLSCQADAEDGISASDNAATTLREHSQE